MDRVDAVVVGAGVVGLAIARELAQRGHETIILEADNRFGSGTSARNSEVIHAGLYYPESSLKAELCVEGRDRLYAYCEARRVPHRRIGKLIFAARDEQLGGLADIARAGAGAGVDDLRFLSAQEAAQMEPALRCVGALLSPSSGIVDSHALMTALLADAEDAEAVLACNTAVERVTRSANGWLIHVAGHGPVLIADSFVNAAGLGAQSLAHSIEGLGQADVPPQYLAKGSYFTYSGKVPFARLIYPLPEPGGLGTHLTLDLAGQARFGPDVEWIERIDFTVDPGRKAAFVDAARRIWADIDPERLQPGYAGIRPKIVPPGAPPADFVISGPADHGLAGLVNLFGIELPGLTASLAIAEHVGRLVGSPSARGIP